MNFDSIHFSFVSIFSAITTLCYHGIFAIFHRMQKSNDLNQTNVDIKTHINEM